MHFEIIEKTPSAQVYNQLRQAVGWRTFALEVIETALPNSLYCLCACLGDQIVGMARVVGDGGLSYYIQDVIVLPEYQGHGIGTRLMDRIMVYISTHARHNSVIGLMSAEGKEPFYERYGFVTRPAEKMGSGMTLYWKTDKAG